MEQLETGLWYRSTVSKTNSIYFLKNISSNSTNPHFSYGISGIGTWSESMDRHFPKFQLAEEEVVSNVMKNEARKRYKGKKLQCLIGGYPVRFTGAAIDFYFKDNDMWSDGAVIYRNGRWADTIDKDIKETHYEIY